MCQLLNWQYLKIDLQTWDQILKIFRIANYGSKANFQSTYILKKFSKMHRLF